MKRTTALITAVVFVCMLIALIVFANVNMAGIETAQSAVEAAEDGFEASRAANADIYGILTILPPLVAIALAFVTKNVIVSMGAGVFVGSFMISLVKANSAIGTTTALGTAFISMVPRMMNQLADTWNAGVVLQCLTIGGMVALIVRTGGAQAIAKSISKLAKNVRSTTLATWLMGLVVFFDDYANSLIVGPMMRPVTDRNKMSREKLAFIVDATAAPVAGIAVISTWIATELTAIQSGYMEIGVEASAYSIFMQTIPYRFYNIFMLGFVVIIALMARDFGPMLLAERRARAGKPFADTAQIEDTSEDEAAADKNGNIWMAIVPILALVVTAFLALFFNGFEAAGFAPGTPFSFEVLRESFGNADAAFALFLAALVGSIVSLVMGLLKKSFKLEEGINTWIKGVKSLVITAIILLLAWTLTSTIKELGTNLVLSRLVSQSVPYFLLPVVIFLIGCLISFATGTSYGTMLILTPLTIPAAHGVLQLQNVPFGHEGYMMAAIGAVLAGAIFGDHCSPISDTTILSSMGAGSDHLDHVKTQMPYALFIAGISIVCGYLLTGFGLNPYIALLIGFAAIVGCMFLIGKNPDLPVKAAKQEKAKKAKRT